MKRVFALLIAAAFGLALTATAQAQTRHDEKPHGTPKSSASATTAKQVKQPRIAGRHDERPGTSKPAAP